MNEPQNPPTAPTPIAPPPATGDDTTVVESDGDTTVGREPAPRPTEDPAHAAARDARFAELRRLYPRQRVAIRDEWDGAQLVEPFVLAVSDDYAVLYGAIESLPAEQRGRCRIEFLMPRYWAKFAPLFYRGPGEQEPE